MHGTSELTEIEQQLLMAAAVCGFGPRTDLSGANTVRIVNQVLVWRGLTSDQIDSIWSDQECDSDVYTTLVRMTHQWCSDGSFRPGERAGPALFQGGGNWGVPGDPDRPACWPHYNSCRLTAEGKRLAQVLLEQHPEYRESAKPRATTD
jgi:hypothetical protein